MESHTITLPWWTILYLFGLPILLIILTAALAVATYRTLKKIPHKPVGIAVIIILWLMLAASWLYFQRIF